MRAVFTEDEVLADQTVGRNIDGELHRFGTDIAGRDGVCAFGHIVEYVGPVAAGDSASTQLLDHHFGSAKPGRVAAIGNDPRDLTGKGW